MDSTDCGYKYYMHCLTIDEKAALSLKDSMVRGFGARKKKGRNIVIKIQFPKWRGNKEEEKFCRDTVCTIKNYKRFKSTSNLQIPNSWRPPSRKNIFYDVVWYGWECQGDQRGNKIASSMKFSLRVKRKKGKGEWKEDRNRGIHYMFVSFDV